MKKLILWTGWLYGVVVSFIGLPVMAAETACDTISLAWTAEAGEKNPLRVGVSFGANRPAGQETFCVDWGDGTYLYAMSSDTSFTKTYAESGSYAVVVYTTLPEVRIHSFACDRPWDETNGVTSLDVTRNSELQSLDCSYNQLTSLDVTRNSELQSLDCSYNQLTSLDVSQNSTLQRLSCFDNQLTSLDVSRNLALEYLACSRNQLTSLDVTQNPLLVQLYCYDNMRIVDLDVDNGLELDMLPGMDVSRIGSVRGGRLSGTRLSFEAAAVSYRYAIGYSGENEEVSDTVEFYLFAAVCDTIFMTWEAGAGDEKSLSIGLLDLGISQGTTIFSVDWGDGTRLESCATDTSFTKTYSAAGNYAVVVYTTLPEVLIERFECNGNNTWDGTNGVTSLDVLRNAGLRYLNCYNNQLTSLDVTQNPLLVHLYCSVNQLTSLDVTQNAYLNNLYCQHNQLTSLDVTQNAYLWCLVCDNNQLTSLDVTQNAGLVHLYCSVNQLTSLDVTQNMALELLRCSSNQLPSLDVSQNLVLEYLWCDHNQLTSLDITQNPLLADLRCSNNVRVVELDDNVFFDLRTLPGMDVSRIGSVTGGYIDGTRLFFNADEVTYRYATHFSGDISLGFDTVEFRLLTAICDTIFMTWTAEAGEEKPLRIGVSVDANWPAGRETFCVDWGDGTYLYAMSSDTSFTKTYAEGGSYAVMVYTTAPEVRINSFYCSGTWEKSNGVTSLDVTQNSELQALYCGYNQLTSLDVTRNLALVGLYCWDNQLTSLDITQNPLLADLRCSNNVRVVELDDNVFFDLRTLPGMDVSRIGSVTGGYIDGTRLFFNADEVTYRYATHFSGDISLGFDTVEFMLMTSAPLTPPIDTTANESALSAAPFAYVQGRTAYLADGLGEVEAFTVTGQCVYRGFDHTIELLRPGVYVLCVVSDGRCCKVVVR